MTAREFADTATSGSLAWFPQRAIDRTTLQGWTRWCQARDAFIPAPRITYAEYKKMSERRRRIYDLHRFVTHGNLPILETPMTTSVSDAIATRMLAGATGAMERTRAGAMLSGGGYQGKTETICRICADFHDEWLELHGQLNPNAIAGTRDLFVPVAYVQTPVTASPISTCAAILDFYGEDYKGMTLSALGRTVRSALVDHGTQVLVLDDITRLKLHREADSNSLDLIRGFMDVTVLVLVGVDIPASGLLRGGRQDPHTGEWVFPSVPDSSKSPNDLAGKSTDRRFKLVNMDAFSYGTPQTTTAWVEHLAGIETRLRLFRGGGQPLTSGDMPDYLYRRTGGIVGYLAILIMEACLLAIKTGTEQLSRDLLASIDIEPGELPGRDPMAGEVPTVPAPPDPPHDRARGKRGRNTVFDDHGAQARAAR
jgi:hypothetical protein